MTWVMGWATAWADVKLPAVIGSHMVLQRDQPLPIWGWADPGEDVVVRLGEREAKATADKDGNWKVRLEKMPAGGPHKMTIQGKNTVTLEDILVGEVWIGSGQSNMEWSVSASDNPKEEIEAAKYPQIRLFHVPKIAPSAAEKDVNASWKVCSPETIPGFSAVLFFFGRAVHKELGVPMGLINSSWGGSPIEPWIAPEGYAAVPALDGILQPPPDLIAVYRRMQETFLDAVAKKANEHLHPKAEKEDDVDGGAAEDDTALKIPVPKDPQLDNAKAIEKWLPGARKAMEEGKDLPALPGGWPRGWPEWPQDPRKRGGGPCAMYNGMIYPLAPFALRGALWYQGESNRGRGMFYHELMKGLIAGWRKVWGQGDFPFYFVQLAPFRYGGDAALLPEIWEAQTATLSVPNTGMAVIVDIGNVGDIHPRNKQEVGRRLSLWAMAKTYGKTGIVYSGPLYKSMAVEENKVRIRFDHVGGGLASRDGNPLSHFTLAGEDKKFVVAKAEIDGDTVVVSSPGLVDKPVAVRFAWDHTAEPNLMNKEGLPASPFRTDKWTKEPEPAQGAQPATKP
jgi:sialate O-acetylesterase